MQGPNVNRVQRAWGANPPDWIMALAERCDKLGSQGEVGRELAVSAAVVNQVLGRSYKGRMARVESLVRGRYMKATVQCPVLDEISTNECLANQAQAKKFKATNPLRVRLYTACRACPNRETEPCSNAAKTERT